MSDFNSGFNTGKNIFNKLSNLSKYEPVFWGDCMKLAVSKRINIFWVRIFFIVATLFYGIGIAVYLIIHFRPQTIEDVSSAIQNLTNKGGNKMNDNQKKGIAFIVGGFLSLFIIPFILKLLGFYMINYYLHEYYLIYIIAGVIAWQGIKILKDKTGNENKSSFQPIEQTETFYGSPNKEEQINSSSQQTSTQDEVQKEEQTISPVIQQSNNNNNLNSQLNLNKMKVTISIDQQAKSTMFGLGATKHSYKLNVSFQLAEKEKKIFNDHPLLQEMRFMDYMQGKRRDIPLSITAKDIYSGRPVSMEANSVNEMIEFRNEVHSAAEKFVGYVDVLSDILGGKEMSFG